MWHSLGTDREQLGRALKMGEQLPIGTRELKDHRMQGRRMMEATMGLKNGAFSYSIRIGLCPFQSSIDCREKGIPKAESMCVCKSFWSYEKEWKKNAKTWGKGKRMGWDSFSRSRKGETIFEICHANLRKDRAWYGI